MKLLNDFNKTTNTIFFNVIKLFLLQNLLIHGLIFNGDEFIFNQGTFII